MDKMYAGKLERRSTNHTVKMVCVGSGGVGKTSFHVTYRRGSVCIILFIS